MTLPGGSRAPVKVAAAVMAAGLLAGCTGGSAPVPPRPPGKGSYFHRAGAINLQNGSYPSFLAFGSRDTLWLTENGGNVIASVDASGGVRQYSILAGTNNDPQDIINVPDGSIWFTDDGGHVCRIRSASTFGCYAVHPATRDIWMRGLAMGADGALWFTEDNLGSATDTQNAIGRLTARGSYSRWQLPPDSGPTRIAAGPDGALWFTERSGQSIGRITTSGMVTQFPLPRGVYPFDIVSGPGKALWFTTDTRVGRITTTGQITLWPVTGAQQFGGLAVAPDGSLWLADGVASTIRHFVPPATGP